MLSTCTCNHRISLIPEPFNLNAFSMRGIVKNPTIQLAKEQNHTPIAYLAMVDLKRVLAILKIDALC